MKLNLESEENLDTSYVLTGLHSISDRVLFEIEFDNYPSKEEIKKIIENESERTFYSIDIISIEEIKTKYQIFTVDED